MSLVSSLYNVSFSSAGSWRKFQNLYWTLPILSPKLWSDVRNCKQVQEGLGSTGERLPLPVPLHLLQVCLGPFEKGISSLNARSQAPYLLHHYWSHRLWSHPAGSVSPQAAGIAAFSPCRCKRCPSPPPHAGHSPVSQMPWSLPPEPLRRKGESPWN